MTNGNHPHKSSTLAPAPKTDKRATAAKETMGSAGSARPAAAKGEVKQPPRMT